MLIRSSSFVETALFRWWSSSLICTSARTLSSTPRSLNRWSAFCWIWFPVRRHQRNQFKVSKST